MAELTKEFKVFHDKIILTASKKSTLRTARDAIREKVRKHFRETLKLTVPKFRGQGSYAMGTIVNPIDLDTQEDSAWPAATTVHQWLVNATDGHTSEKPMDKRTCVRVRYAGQYHVDLPSYGELNGKYLLAVKGESNWPQSDPLALTDWFKDQVKSQGEQLRRVVRYLKAWADFQSQRRGKMPSGLVLTVLAANSFHSHEKDAVALANTLRAISAAVSTVFFVLNPVDNSEELTARLTDAQKTRLQNAAKTASEDAIEAVSMEDEHKASMQWRKQFGDRFPKIEKKESQQQKQYAAKSLSIAVAGINPPKPWGWR